MRSFQIQLLCELETKFSGKHTVFMAQRWILCKPSSQGCTKKRERRRKKEGRGALEANLLVMHAAAPVIPSARDSAVTRKAALSLSTAGNVEHTAQSLPGLHKRAVGKDVHYEFLLAHSWIFFHFYRQKWLNKVPFTAAHTHKEWIHELLWHAGCLASKGSGLKATRLVGSRQWRV